MPNFHQILNAICGAAMIAAHVVYGQSDQEVLLELKNFLQVQSPINRGAYDGWPESEDSPCNWKGVGCDTSGHVYFLDLSSSNISGPSFSNFSHLTWLTHLDLSANSITGELQADLKRCWSLQYLNISNNLIGGILNVSSLTNLHTLDVSQNRFQQRIDINFPAICGNLSFLSVASNNLTGRIDGLFDSCLKLKYVDLSGNSFTGTVWRGISRLTQFKSNNNNLTGTIPSSSFTSSFTTGCNLQSLNIASNYLYGSFPNSIANCTSLIFLPLMENSFGGSIPIGIGSIAGLEELILASNRFDGKIPLDLKNCTSLKYLDISDNNFGGEVQAVFGESTSLSSLLLEQNNYTGGIISSGILQLPQLSMLDLSNNKFSGELPSTITRMTNTVVLILAENNFSGTIPPEYGQLVKLQVLDLSFNSLSGRIPPEISNLTSLLLLVPAGNQLSGEIPAEIGNCSILLWLNMAANRLSGRIPSEMANIGRNPSLTYMENQKNIGQFEPITSKCQAVDRWVPANYPEFSFVKSMMTSQKNCRAIWIRLAMGYDPLPLSSYDTAIGYVQLSGNLLLGEIPSTIGEMENFGLFLLDGNQLSGHLPSEIGKLQLNALNISNNSISGEIPSEIGHMGSLESLDFSWNNFSGAIPLSLNQLTQLSNSNVSYNPLLSGEIPRTGQLSTFDEQSFLGDPLLSLHSPAGSTSQVSPSHFSPHGIEKNPTREEILVSGIAFLVFFIITFAVRECQSFMYMYCIVSCETASCRA